MNPQKILVSSALIVAVIGGITYLDSQKADRRGNDGDVSVVPRLSNDNEKNQTVSSEDKDVAKAMPSSDEKTTSIQKSKKYTVAKEITTPDGFINTDGKSITIGEFVGKKVVLLDIWTYSCINCQRTTPYLNAWYEKYKDKGLVIIGLHTPEFEFEKVYQNVLDATKRLGINYPVVLDNDYSTWNAYQNRFWPRKYLIDIDGYVVYDHIGEGGYEETEKKIQELLEERARILENETTGVSDSLAVAEVPLITIATQSPETYFGSLRNGRLANGMPGDSGTQTFSLPKTITRNALYLGGAWNITTEFAEAVSDASVVYTYNAKEVYIVADADVSIEVEVLQDGAPVGVSGGEDVRTGGIVTMKESRLYKLIRNQEPGEHTLELKIKGKGLRLYAFTFG